MDLQKFKVVINATTATNSMLKMLLNVENILVRGKMIYVHNIIEEDMYKLETLIITDEKDDLQLRGMLGEISAILKAESIIVMQIKSHNDAVSRSVDTKTLNLAVWDAHFRTQFATMKDKDHYEVAVPKIETLSINSSRDAERAYIRLLGYNVVRAENEVIRQHSEILETVLRKMEKQANIKMSSTEGEVYDIGISGFTRLEYKDIIRLVYLTKDGMHSIIDTWA